MTRYAKNRNAYRTLLATVLVALMLGSFLPLFPGASAQQEEPEEWEVGDSWSMGFEEELSLDFDYEGLLEELMDEELDLEGSEIEDMELKIDGLIGAYYITEVVEVSPQYKLKVTASFGLHGSVKLESSALMYEPGHHSDVSEADDGSWLLPKETRHPGLSADFEIAFLAEGYEYREAQTMAITRQSFSVESAGNVKLLAEDLQDVQVEQDWEDDSYLVSVYYNELEIKVDWDAYAQLSVDYSPYLESRPRGEDIGDIWELSYSSATSGSYGGTLKLSLEGDIPDDDQGHQSISETFDLSSELFDSAPFVGGVIQRDQQEMEVEQEIVGREMVVMPDGSAANCYVIVQRETDDNPEDEYEGEDLGYYYYSPSHQRTVLMKGADLPQPELEELSSEYVLGPESVSKAQEFNRRFADPDRVGGGEEAGNFDFLMAGAVLGILAAFGIGFALYQRREPRERSRSAPSFSGPRFQPQTPQTPGQSFSSYSPYRGIQASPARQGQQTARLCPGCGTAAQYVAGYQTHYCPGCKRYLPGQQTGYGQPLAGGLPSLSNNAVQQFSPAQQPRTCRVCGAQGRYVSIYQRHFCDICREFL